MASIQRSGNKWRVQVYVAGVRDSTTKHTKQEAAKWALEREAELRGGKLPDKSLREAMRRYVKEEAPKRAGERWESVRIAAWERSLPLLDRRIATVSSSDIIAWRDGRLKQVKRGTVAREMNLMRSVFETARREWKWIKQNPMSDVRWPQQPKGRARRVSPTEEADLIAAFGLDKGLSAETATQRTGLAFLLALETAMRSGEILSLTWPNVHLSEQYVYLPKTKNGDARDVPLSRRACEILRTLPLGFGPVFQLKSPVRDALCSLPGRPLFNTARVRSPNAS
ncbi:MULTISPECIES: tyrosine-type recombinase/integrase [Stenotrophomonas maltophilia group]|uniref:tyrosine-type recombinase/integrase n=1 Tax=Stenotrophomonas maltophilia group TaxID=995085 RepID=UPI00300E7C47